MSFLQALFFGLLQGITEFFPVSSSAHLTLLKYLFNLKDLQDPAFFNLTCHLGTTLSTIVFLRKEIISILFKKPKEILYFSLALLPLVLFYPLIGKSIKAYSANPHYLGFAFLVTALLLTIAAFSKTRKTSTKTDKKQRCKKSLDVLFIGLMQVLALVPGLSRSGATIFAGSFRGWSLKEILTFSFLLAIPTILGGSVIEIARHLKTQSLAQTQSLGSIEFSSYLTAFLASFIFGLICIRLIFALKYKKRLLYFAAYTFLMGIFSLIYLNNVVL